MNKFTQIGLLLIFVFILKNVEAITSPFETKSCSPCPNPPELETLIQKFPESVVKYYIETTRFRHSLDKSFTPTCDRKYPDKSRFKQMVEKLKTSNTKLFFSVIMHNNEKIFAHWYNQFMTFLSWFPNDHLFVSVREYNSRDRTPIWLNLMSKVMEARGIPHEFHLDNSIKVFNKNEILQSSISPIFSKTFNRAIFLEAYAFCAEDLLTFIEGAVKADVAFAPVRNQNTLNTRLENIKNEEECTKTEGIFSIDPEEFRGNFNFEKGFCNIFKTKKVTTVEAEIYDTKDTLDKSL